MSITHVATQPSGIIPGGVAEGDLVITLTSVDQKAVNVAVAAGWSLIAQSMILGFGKQIFWCRWAPGIPSVGSVLDSRRNAATTVWRGARGIRDFAARIAANERPLTTPGLRGEVGDVLLALFNGLWSDFSADTTGTTPATTVRNATRGVYIGSVDVATAGTTGAYTTNGGPWSLRSIEAAMVLCEAIAPLAPTLDSPAPSAVVDLAAGGTFTWQHRPSGFAGSASGDQDAYALRRRVGVGAYEYWSAGTASWSASAVWNASVDGSVAFPAGAWTNETQYAWSVATREDAGSNTGPFAPDRTLFARTKPVVTITAPDTVVSTPQPEITWTATYTSPWEAIAYEVSIFPTDQADTPGFDPATVAPVWTSGQYASTATTVTPSIPLANGTSYAVMVRVQQTGGQWSDWERTDTLVSLAAPASPHVDAVPSTDPLSGCPVVTVTVSARDNLLSAADASVEVPNTWEAGANTGITETSDWAADGAQSLELTATAAGDVSCVLPDPLPVAPDTLYTGTATVHAAATVRDVTVTILWEDSTGTSLGSSPSLAVEDDTTGVVVQVTGIAPPNAAGARLQVTIAGCAAGEVHHADKFGIAPGTGTPWSPGGFTDVTATVEFSDDPLSGVWGTLATDTLDGQTVITDWTAQPGQLRTYRATTNAGTYSSPPSEVALAGIDVTDYWLVDVDAQSATPVRLRTDETRTHPRDRGEFAAFDREVSLMRYGTVRSVRGAYTAMTQTGAAVDALVDLLNSGHTILVQAPREEGVYPRHLYMAVVDDPTTERVVQAPYAWRVVSWSWRADTPPVGEGYGGTFPAGYAGTL